MCTYLISHDPVVMHQVSYCNVQCLHVSILTFLIPSTVSSRSTKRRHFAVTFFCSTYRHYSFNFQTSILHLVTRCQIRLVTFNPWSRSVSDVVHKHGLICRVHSPVFIDSPVHHEVRTLTSYWTDMFVQVDSSRYVLMTFSIKCLMPTDTKLSNHHMHIYTTI